eukprot:TRINITY_DN1745_c0_g1_i1.p1 TRINITY_DN1745_c0_g1~~TRINITY_DN1745_c0_g1_i1.p1  ORF type:complete len:544 (-),score=126.51 TRINITY_DN1745_c0_g1_i1:211-1842(-)
MDDSDSDLEFYDAAETDSEVEESNPDSNEIEDEIAELSIKQCAEANNEIVEEESKEVTLDMDKVDKNNSEEIMEEKFMIKDLSTGKATRIDELELDDALFGNYTTFDQLGPGLNPSADEPDEKPKKGKWRKLFKKSDTKTNEPKPEGWTKTSVHKRNETELTDLRVIQSAKQHKSAIWVGKFNKSGAYFATAGQDKVIFLWRVKALVKEGDEAEHSHVRTRTPESVSSACETVGDAVPFFEDAPYRRFSGHKSHVVDLSWSHTDFLLSASIDSCVRLWHPSRPDCLCLFQHSDLVTSVAFHPTKETFFVTGSFDKKVRVWNAETGRVTQWAHTPTMVTSVAYSPDGERTVAGLYNGKCYFFQSDGLRYFTHIDCRNRRGKDSKGRKVTGLEFTDEGRALLVTTNDSRVRYVQLDGFSVVAKFKGNQNSNMQIVASVDDNGERLICGSEDKCAYMWRTNHDMYQPSINPKFSRFKKDRDQSYEYFEAHTNVVTVARFIPKPAKDAYLKATGRAIGDEENHIMLVTGSVDGSFKVFDNLSAPRKC